MYTAITREGTTVYGRSDFRILNLVLNLVGLIKVRILAPDRPKDLTSASAGGCGLTGFFFSIKIFVPDFSHDLVYSGNFEIHHTIASQNKFSRAGMPQV